MIEVYEGEQSVVITLPDAYTVEDVQGFQTIFDTDGQDSENEVTLAFEENAISGYSHKEVVVDVSALSQWPTPFTVVLTYTDSNDVERFVRAQYEVVTPYASVSDIASTGGFSSDPYLQSFRSSVQIREVETLARRVVEAYTGLEFGRSYKKVRVEGTNSDKLYLNQEASWIGAVFLRDGELLYPETGASYVLSPSGHVLQVRDSSGEHYGFPAGYDYDVVGIFGPSSVPHDVNLATKQLAIHYLCMDASSLNKYVESTKRGESGTKHDRRAFSGTGLRAADILLDHYRGHKYLLL